MTRLDCTELEIPTIAGPWLKDVMRKPTSFESAEDALESTARL